MLAETPLLPPLSFSPPPCVSPSASNNIPDINIHFDTRLFRHWRCSASGSARALSFSKVNLSSIGEEATKKQVDNGNDKSRVEDMEKPSLPGVINGSSAGPESAAISDEDKELQRAIKESERDARLESLARARE